MLVGPQFLANVGEIFSPRDEQLVAGARDHL